MIERPRLFVELCAGLAAVSLRLVGGEHCRPPVSRMGNKAGYAKAILGAMGLRAGQGADALLLCEPDDGCRALLQAYGRPDVLAEAAEIIRGWKDEDPRALWERLRAEGPVGGSMGVARWAWLGVRSHKNDPRFGFIGAHPVNPTPGHLGGANYGPTTPAARLGALPTQPPITTTPDARLVSPREIARWIRIVSSNRLVNVDPHTWMNTGNGGTRFGGEFCTPAGRLADAVEVARHALTLGWSIRGDQYFRGPSGVSSGIHARNALTREGLAQRFEGAPIQPALAIGADAREIEPPADLEGVYVFVDPPYSMTTGYQHDLGRAEVVALARRWSDAGAVVAISEQEPVTGWADDLYPVDITETRKGQKRTFSKQQREILTINRPPVEKPAEQISMFAAK